MAPPPASASGGTAGYEPFLKGSRLQERNPRMGDNVEHRYGPKPE